MSIALLDGTIIGKDDVETLRKENEQLKLIVFQLDTARRDLNVLSMVLVERLLESLKAEELEITKEELESISKSNTGLQVRADEEENSLFFSVVDLPKPKPEDSKVEDEQSQQESTEDTEEKVHD